MSLLSEVRKDLMASGMSEAEVLADMGGVQSMFGQIQELTMEMNTAKKEAAALAAAPYLETIEQIKKRYAMMVKLSSR